MKYINKDTHLQQGHDITDRYLENVCKVDDNGGNYHYQNVDYVGSFGTSHAKDDMLRLALTNQENYCCYCMRDLHMQNQRTTLEHIIPQSCNAEKFNSYTEKNVAHLTTDDVVRTGDFTNVENETVPPRPHTVTFENLVASCDGTFPDKNGTSQCCNNRRGEHDVYPMFYIAGVEDEISYMQDGTMQPNAQCMHQDEYRQTIANVRLNCQNLKDIRRLWHLFGNEELATLIDCLNDKNRRNLLLTQVLYQDERFAEQDVLIQIKFMKDAYWQTFLLYHWFYHKV